MAYTFHTRIEPRTRSDDLALGLAARVYDPAWLLARQWQLGELNGDDGGNPIRVRHTGEITFCSNYFDSAGSRELAPGDGPIEAWVEGEAVSTTSWTLRRRVEVGRALMRALPVGADRDARAAAVLTAFPIAPADFAEDPTVAGLLDLVLGRVPDGANAMAALEPHLRSTPPSLPPITGIRIDNGLIAAAQAWLASCDSVYGRPLGGGWDSSRLEHEFSMGIDHPTSSLGLMAREHQGGEVDWWSFDATRLAGAPGVATTNHDATLIPTRVSFRGMPNPRWWEVEDAVIDLGGVEAHPADLARMAVLHFALVYGNDHFVVPVATPVGSLFRTSHVLITDTFGFTLSIGPAAQQTAQVAGTERWTMFTLSLDENSGVVDGFLLPAKAMDTLSSRPVEEVHLLRDEMANLAWAVEHGIEGEDGRLIVRSEMDYEEPTPASPAPAGLAWTLGTTVPAHWFPLVPQRRSYGDAPDLKVETMAFSPHQNAVPRGTFLTAGLRLADDRIPREGRRLVRERVMTRWSDGSTLAWTRRRALIGRGEGSSGLLFDVAEERPQS